MLLYLHEIRHKQAIDDEAGCVFSTDRGLADVLTERTHLVNRRKETNYTVG